MRCSYLNTKNNQCPVHEHTFNFNKSDDLTPRQLPFSTRKRQYILKPTDIFAWYAISSTHQLFIDIIAEGIFEGNRINRVRRCSPCLCVCVSQAIWILRTFGLFLFGQHGTQICEKGVVCVCWMDIACVRVQCGHLFLAWFLLKGLEIITTKYIMIADDVWCRCSGLIKYHVFAVLILVVLPKMNSKRYFI